MFRLGFGNTKMRKYQEQNGRWTDKSAAKHKHDYSVPVLVKVICQYTPQYPYHYFAMKCRYCNSFHTMPILSNKTGFIRDDLVRGYYEQYDVPVLTLESSKQWVFGFRGCKFIGLDPRS